MKDYREVFVPEGMEKSALKTRRQLIMDFYVEWIKEHPDKVVWNKALNDYIHVKFLSINETVEKASISTSSTRAVFKLTEILENSIVVGESPVKTNNKNQKPFEKMLIMRYENIRLIVGVQRSNKDKVQYCITAIQ